MDRLQEQREYYRQRAPEYDQWWQARGQYAKTPEEERRWFADVAEVERALDAFAPAGDVLELAAGTGWWTRRLARHAGRLTAVDANAETLALNREKTAAFGNVDYVLADIFSWTPPAHAFDVVFFSYWLSHVPPDRLAAFQQQVSAALRPGGRVFVMDSYRTERIDGDVQERVLSDGRRFQVIKRYWQPAELEAIPGWGLTARITSGGTIVYAATE